MATPFYTDTPIHHWIRLSDADLAYILNGPDGSVEDGDEEWIDEVIDIIEDGLETA